MTSKNEIKLASDKKGQGYAKIYSAMLKDEYQRKRSYASLCALYAFVEYIQSNIPDVNLQNSMTLFKNPSINEEFEFSDIYINGRFIDVRIVTTDDFVLIPAIHADNDLMPDFYAVIKTDKNLSEFSLSGFVDTSKTEPKPYEYRYRSVALSELISYDEFINKIKNMKPPVLESDSHDILEKEYLKLTDNEIDKDNKIRLIKHMIKCEDCRREFCCFTGFEMVSVNVGRYPDLTADKTLDIIGAQAVEKGEYKGEEETLYIGDLPAELENEAEDFQENIINSEENTTEEIAPDEPVTETKIEDDPAAEEILEESDITENIQNEDTNIVEELPQNELNLSNDSDDMLDELFDINNLPAPPASFELEYSAVTDNEQNDTFNEKLEEPEKTPEQDNEDSDILDELFNIDEITPEPENTTTKPVTSETPEENSEIQKQELNIAANNNESEIQKVIVDYDEEGKPVYSYVNPIEDNSAELEENIHDESEDYIEDDDLIAEIEDNIDENIAESFVSDEKTGQTEENIDEISDFETINDDEIKNEELNETDDNLPDDIAPETFAAFNESPQPGNTAHNLYDSGVENMVNQVVSDENTEDEDDDDSFDDYTYYSEDDNNNENEDMRKDDEIYYDEENNEEITNYNLKEKVSHLKAEEQEENAEYEDDEEENTGKKSNFAAVAAVFIVIIGLLGLGAGGFYYMKQKQNPTVAAAQNEPAPAAETQDDMFASQPATQETQQPAEPNPDNNAVQNTQDSQAATANNNGQPNNALTEQDLLKKTNTLTNDSDSAITGAFTGATPSITLTSLNWKCSPQLFTDKSFKKFLKNTDNVLKYRLKENLQNATERPKSTSAEVKISVNNDGSLDKKTISLSSGSEQIDNLVLQSVNESFNGGTPIISDGPAKAEKYYLSVVLKF